MLQMLCLWKKVCMYWKDIGINMNFGKRIASVGLCCCLITGAIAAGRLYSEEINGNAFVSNDSVSIWYTDENMTDYINAMAVAFQEEEGIRVLPQLHSGLDYLEDVYNASVREEDGPDLYIVSNEALQKAYLSGLAAEIKDENGLVTLENFPQSALNAVTYRGKKVGYPYYFETSVILYNKTYIAEMAKNQLLLETSEEPKSDQEAQKAQETSDEATKEISDQMIDERVEELIPQTFDELLTFADSYDAPQAVEAVFKWDVQDIFYNYFFVGNYMNVGGPCGDTSEKVDIYNLDTIKAMKVYQDLNQFFSFESEDVAYASVIQEFMEGKLVLTTATSDIMKTLEAAKEEGTFAFEYGLAPIPDLNEEMQTKSLSVTNTIVLNGFSDNKENAEHFASYLAGNAVGTLYEKTGKIPAKTTEACANEKTSVFYKEYSDSVPVPKMMVTSNLWVQLEVTFAKVWNGAEVSKSLQELSEMIMSQVTGAEYTEEYINEPVEEESSIEYFDEEAEREAAQQEN